MKKPILSIDEPEPKKAPRADRPPTEGFVMIVDGHFKTEFDTVEAAEASGRELRSAYPRVQIEIYDAVEAVTSVRRSAFRSHDTNLFRVRFSKEASK